MLNLELLETRNLCSVLLGSDGVLRIDGTSGNDVIVIRLEGSTFLVEGQSFDGVKRIEVNAKNGWDLVKLELDVDWRMLSYCKTKHVSGTRRIQQPMKVAISYNVAIATDAFFAVRGGKVGKAGGLIVDIGDPVQLGQPVDDEYDEDGDRDDWFVIMEHIYS